MKGYVCPSLLTEHSNIGPTIVNNVSFYVNFIHSAAYKLIAFISDPLYFKNLTMINS